ncbi:MAG: TcpQ domain-containing protein [Alphaproteobacteria bacterium]|nr:TcpQ domain-containing protein [Alphaproteobacteria bacterium]
MNFFNPPSAHPVHRLARMGLLWTLWASVSWAQNTPAMPADTDNAALFADPVTRTGSVELDRVQKFDTLPTDRSVSRLLERWARQSGVGFVWNAKSDVTLSSQDRFIGTIEQATERLIGGVSGITLQACIYSNNPPVIRITESGTPCE